MIKKDISLFDLLTDEKRKEKEQAYCDQERAKGRTMWDITWELHLKRMTEVSNSIGKVG